MKRNPIRHQSGMRPGRMQQTERSGRDTCISCHLRAGYNILARSMKILRTLATRKKPGCNAAVVCRDTGLPMSGKEPPQAENCECRLTQDLACAVMEIEGQLDRLLEKGDRLALLVERGGTQSEIKTRWQM
jgi:hypothetical protein